MNVEKKNKSNIVKVEASCFNCGKMLVSTPDEITGNSHDVTVQFNCPFCKDNTMNVFIKLRPFSISDIIDNLDEKEAKQIIRDCALIADPLSQALIKKAME